MKIEDKDRLNRIDRQKNILYYARIVILDKDENPIQTIEGRVQPGSSVSINGSSSLRRTCNLSLIADDNKNDLTDIDNLLSINKKIKIYTGIKQNIDWGKDVIYFESYTHEGSDPPLIMPGENGKIYINKRNKLYLTSAIIDGETHYFFDRKAHNDFVAYYWDESNQIYQKLNNIYDYENIVFWFSLGVYVITQPSLSSGSDGCRISLSCQDKMCLLNGTMGGNLPASVTFDSYDQEIGYIDLGEGEEYYPPVEEPNDYNIYCYNQRLFMYDKKFGWQLKTQEEINKIGNYVTYSNLIYDIIQTLVINYGEELMTKVIINDVPKEIKQIVRYTGSSPLYFNYSTGIYTYDASQVTDQDIWQVYHYNDEIGYVWTDFIYPTGSNNKNGLVSGIGDNVCSVLDKIVQLLGNYEYFYDVDGNFVFQEIKNYLNNSYNPLKEENNMLPYYIDNNKTRTNEGEKIPIENNNILLLGKENYQVDFFGDQKSVYTFNKNNDLIMNYNNNPDYTNLKNDFHIWGKSQDGNVIHYHIVIKEKPKKEYVNGEWVYPEHEVIFKKDAEKHYTGKIRKIEKEDFADTYATVMNNSLDCVDKTATYVENHVLNIEKDITKNSMTMTQDNTDEDPSTFALKCRNDEKLKHIRANDWRAEIYLQGLEKVALGDRPDKYEQELLDFFDSIYQWGYYENPELPTDNTFHFEGRFKTDITSTPNELKYFIDYLEPVDSLYGMSVDDIGAKILAEQNDKIIKLYDDDVPNLILINFGWSDRYKNKIQMDCNKQGQPFSIIESKLFDVLAENIVGYTAQETARNFLYQYTNYNETISIQSVPIYYLDVNQRITVEDDKTGIHGDFIIKSISMPVTPDGTMSISAVPAISRI